MACVNSELTFVAKSSPAARQPSATVRSSTNPALSFAFDITLASKLVKGEITTLSEPASEIDGKIIE